MNALVQRAGRTARYERRCEGVVSVFNVAGILPYSDENKEITRSRDCLAELTASGEIVDFKREQLWIEHVHGVVEAESLAAYTSLFSRRELVELAIRSGDRGRLPDLVRRIDTVNVLLSGQPHNVEFHRANWPSLLSVPRSAVWSLKGAIESLSDCVWAAKEVEEESGPLRFTWAPIKASSAIKGCWLIAIAPEAADYCSQVGLRLGQPGREHALQYNLRAPVPRYHYRYESWIDHIRRVMEEAQRMNAANAIGASRLESKCSLPAGNIFELLILAAALHDIGKLSKTWQKAAWDWETQKTGRTRLGAIAHTTKNLIEKGPDLPPHAVEGAYAVAESLAREFPSGCWPVSCAIARHHSARALQARPFELIDGAAAVLSQLDVPRLNLRNGTMGADLQDFPREIEIEWEDENRELWPIYAYLARRLRLADQAGARRGQGDPC